MSDNEMEEEEEAIFELKCAAPVNIALIKYWGKRDAKLILPFNDSISLTLDEHVLGTQTQIHFSTSFEEDSLCLNEKNEPISERLRNVIDELRHLARREAIRRKSSSAELMRLSRTKFQIKTRNLMPTGAGLASSASGLASLAFGLARCLEISEKTDLTPIARLGSGSACRSLSGGLVQWHRGERENGNDSVAEQVASADHWPGLRVMVLVVKGTAKKISSTSGMQTTMETCSMISTRNDIVNTRIKEIIWAFKTKSFECLAETAMRDSNMLHAMCLDTFPPIAYLSDASHSIIAFVHAFNRLRGATQLGYTFDAGPNAFLLFEEENQQLVEDLINRCFLAGKTERDLSDFDELISQFDQPNSVEYIIKSGLGNGARVTQPKTQL